MTFFLNRNVWMNDISQGHIIFVVNEDQFLQFLPFLVTDEENVNGFDLISVFQLDSAVMFLLFYINVGT